MDHEPALPKDVIDRFVRSVGAEALDRLQGLLSLAGVSAQRTRNRLNGLAGGGPVVIVRGDRADDHDDEGKDDEGWLNNDDDLWSHLDEATRAIDELLPLMDAIATNVDCPPELDGRELHRQMCSSMAKARNGVRMDDISMALEHAGELAERAGHLRSMYATGGRTGRKRHPHPFGFQTIAVHPSYLGTREGTSDDAHLRRLGSRATDGPNHNLGGA